jgi:hypothetical protein
LTEAAGSLTDKAVRVLLFGTIFGPATAIAGEVASVIVKAVLEQLGKEESELSKQVDTILAEPLRFAQDVLEENVAIEVRTRNEKAEQQRQIRTAYDKLRQAHFYAEKKHPELQPLIRAYQAFVSALMSGGKPFAERYVREFDRVAQFARSQSLTAIEEANEIDPDIYERSREELLFGAGGDIQAVNMEIAIDLNIMACKKRKKELEEHAAELNRAASGLEAFSRMIQTLADQTEKLSQTDN